MVFEEKFGLQALVTFDHPFTIKELGMTGKRDAEQIWQAVVERAKRLLNKHTAILEKPAGIDRTQYAG
jgi:hypothetical protein